MKLNRQTGIILIFCLITFVVLTVIFVLKFLYIDRADDNITLSAPNGLKGQNMKNLDNLQGFTGTWTKAENGLTGSGRGDCFSMSATEIKDFIFEAKVTILSGDAASIVFRSNEIGSNAYVANVDLGQNNARIFKFTDNGAVTLGEYKLPDSSKNTYILRIEVRENKMKYLLDGVPIINCEDSQFSSGILGLLICNSETVFQDILYCPVDANTPEITGLSILNQQFTPEFNKDTYSYSLSVPFETESISIVTQYPDNSFINAVKKMDSTTTFDRRKIDGNMEIPLIEGENIIIIGSENGFTTQINVKRKTSPEKYYQEQYRPQYHVTPEVNWLNDPNGMVYYKGEYHLFYQYFPDSKFPADIKYWAHVVSTDLVHWEERPIALSPDQYGSIWSGSAVVDFNNSSGLFDESPDKTGLIAFYTATTEGGRYQQQSMAYSIDNGNTWIKYNDGKPIITNDDDPLHDQAFRDPKVFWHEESGQWMMVVAGGPLRFYSSNNLIDWKPEGMQNEIHTECPDFYKLPVDGDLSNEKWVLSCGGVNYMIGDFKLIGGVWKFEPDTNQHFPFNYGPDVYAAQTFSDTPGRRIKVDWMTNIGYPFENGTITDPWNGALTLPYEMELKTVNGKIKLVQYPVKELDSLRRTDKSFKDVSVSENTENLLKDIKMDKFEINAVIDIKTASEFGFKLRMGKDQYTTVKYNAISKKLTLDRSKSGASHKADFLRSFSTKVDPVDGKIKIQMFIDWSSIELFAQDGVYPFTALIYPDSSSTGMEFYVESGEVIVEELTIYELNSIYNNR